MSNTIFNITCKICKKFFSVTCVLHEMPTSLFQYLMKRFLFVTLKVPLIYFMNVCLCPGPLYGSLLRAWQCFLSSADRLSSLHSSICRALVSEDGDRIRTWQKDTFHKKIFGGFKESQDFETGFSRAQKPWGKRLKKVESNAGIWDLGFFFLLILLVILQITMFTCGNWNNCK